MRKQFLRLLTKTEKKSRLTSETVSSPPPPPPPRFFVGLFALGTIQEILNVSPEKSERRNHITPSVRFVRSTGETIQHLDRGLQTAGGETK